MSERSIGDRFCWLDVVRDTKHRPFERRERRMMLKEDCAVPSYYVGIDVGLLAFMRCVSRTTAVPAIKPDKNLKAESYIPDQPLLSYSINLWLTHLYRWNSLSQL